MTRTMMRSPTLRRRGSLLFLILLLIALAACDAQDATIPAVPPTGTTIAPAGTEIAGPTAPAVATSTAEPTAPPAPSATATPTSEPPTATTEPSPTPGATATPSPTPEPERRYALLGQGNLGDTLDPELLRRQYETGIKVRFVHLGWDVLQPGGPEDWDARTAEDFQARIDAFAGLGEDVQLVLDLGTHYAPEWVATIDPLVDQFGNRWKDLTRGGGANVYWSPAVREHVSRYIRLVFENLDFRGRLWIVRVGTYGGELLYPERSNEDDGLSFWAFDRHARAQNPVPDWLPGQPSPNGEADRFYHWYVDNLAHTFAFFLAEIRRYHDGYVAPVTPGLGMNERTAAQLIERNLVDNSLTTYGTGNYWQSVFAELPGAEEGVINWCSSLGDGSGDDDSPNWWEWSSARQQAHLAHEHGREIFGENTGRNPYEATEGVDPRTTARWIFDALESYGYVGILWVSEASMSDPRYTSLEQFEELIEQHR